MYKVKIPAIEGGCMNIDGQTYDVKEHIIELPTLSLAQRIVVEKAGTLLGMPGLKAAKNVLVIRNQGLGDILMMTPVLRKIKHENPNCCLTFACDLIFLDLLRYLPYIDRLIMIPQTSTGRDEVCVVENDGARTKQDILVDCRMIAEHVDNFPKIATTHRVDIFAEQANLGPLREQERRLDYVVTEEESEWARQEFKRIGVEKNDKVLGMAVRTTAANRNQSAEWFKKIADMCVDSGWKVILFDHDGAFGWKAPGVVNMTGRTTIRQMAAMMSRCRMFFGPDSGAWHLSCALNVPNVVYFGAIDWKLRVTSPRTKVKYKAMPCYPCNRYDCHWQEFAACIKIDPTAILEAILMLDKEIGSERQKTIDFVPEKQKFEVAEGGLGVNSVPLLAENGMPTSAVQRREVGVH